ncbi:MAG: SIS domain-containing protein, partial [Thermoplasmata archaeon]|nr:SIS domain-containing protein [Thermoplasmata archaeon]
ASRLADHRLVTRYAEETSWTHTVSYSSALAASLVLLAAWLPDSTSSKVEPAVIVDAVVDALTLEEKVLELVERLAPARDLLILGSGPAEATAREAALKLREATGRFVASGGVEEFLHGMLPSVSETTGVIAVSGTALECLRARQGLAAAAHIGAVTHLIDSSGTPAEAGEWSISPLPPEIAPISQVIPLQMIAYWMAVSDGRNPDVMALDDARYLEARSSFGI